MGLIYDDPQLAALTLTRIAAEESEGPSAMTGRMRAVLDDLAQRNGAEYLADLVIVLARARFAALDDLARATGTAPPSCWTRWKSTHWKASMTTADPRCGTGSAGVVPQESLCTGPYPDAAGNAPGI
jgi:hypothetical protein